MDLVTYKMALGEPIIRKFTYKVALGKWVLGGCKRLGWYVRVGGGGGRNNPQGGRNNRTWGVWDYVNLHILERLGRYSWPGLAWRGLARIT